MDTQVKLLGKVRPTTDGEHDRSRGYDYLCIVYSSQRNTSYISRRAVPEGIDIDNRTYWQPFGNGKFVSNAIINLSDFDGNSRTLVRYTFDEAVREVHPEDRRLGAILTFYETTADKLESPAWAMYQFNSDDISDWYNKECWIPIYYNKNKFAGWFDTEEDLLAAQPFPHVGDYAFVGSSFADAVVYRCFEDGTWTNTGERATGGVLNIVLTGAVSISPNGTWVIDGVDTGISATGPKGDPGTAAGFGNTTAEISYDNTLIQPTVNVRSSGPNNRKDFHFTFKFPRQSSGGGGNQGGGPGVYVITANNVGEVTYKTSYESQAHAYRGEDACGVLVFMGANEPGDLQEYLNARYQGVPIGTKVIIRSHMYDRGHGKSMGNDGTYYYSVENVTEDGHAISPAESYKRNIRNVLGTYNKTSWYSLYSVTKVSNDTWAGLDWVGRVYPNDWTDSGDESQVDPDTLYTLTIIPSVENAEVYVNGELLGVGTVTKDLPAGSVVSIRCAKAGYQEYNDSIVMPANNYTYNANMVEDVSTQYCTIRLVSVKDNLGNSLANRVTVYYRYPGQPETQISVGESFLVPYGTRYDIDVDAPYGQNPDNYWSGTIMNSVLADGDRDLNLVLERENLARVIVGNGNVAVEDLDALYQNDTKLPSDIEAGTEFIYPEGADLRLIAVKDGYKSAILLDTTNLLGDSTKNVNMTAASGDYLDVIPLKVSDQYTDAEYNSYSWQGGILKISAPILNGMRRAQILIDSNDSFNVRVSQDFDLGNCYISAINKPKTQVWYLSDGGNTNPVDGVYAEFEIQQGNNIVTVQLI